MAAKEATTKTTIWAGKNRSRNRYGLAAEACRAQYHVAGYIAGSIRSGRSYINNGIAQGPARFGKAYAAAIPAAR